MAALDYFTLPKLPLRGNFQHNSHRKTTALVLMTTHLLAALSMAVMATLQPVALAPIVGTPLVALAADNVAGNVYQDYNSNGTLNASTVISDAASYGNHRLAVDRAPVGSVTVVAFDPAGNPVATAATDANGNYTLDLAAVAPGTPLRVEFQNLPAGFDSAAHGPNNGTSVQFVAATSPFPTLNFGVNRASDYCQDNPELAVNLFYKGDPVTGASKDLPGLLSFNDNAGSMTLPVNGQVNSTADDYGLPTNHPLSITASKIGATFGLAYGRSQRALYAAALYKRHAGYGPGGPGAIYKIDPATNQVLATFQVPNCTYNAHDTADYQHDNGNTGWDGTGKSGLGGLAISADGTTLYVMNLENRTLYALDANTGALQGSMAVETAVNPPTPNGTNATCQPDDIRPFAVEVQEEKLYVGLVCSAEKSKNKSDLYGFIYQVDPTNLVFAATPAFSFELGYPRKDNNIHNGSTDHPGGWQPWVPTFQALPAAPTINYRFPVYPQPMLTDIAFDDNGDIILGLRDRFSDQVGSLAPSNQANNTLYYGISTGDLLRACVNHSGGWTLENNGQCGNVQNPHGKNIQEGPGGGEYYAEDASLDALSGPHTETVVGGVGHIPGSPYVITTRYNPAPPEVGAISFHDVGINWFDETATRAQAYRVLASEYEDLKTKPIFAKAAGIGSVVVLCDPAPLEIGNRVWQDLNGDGVQGANEPAIGQVTVHLYRPGFGVDGVAGNGDDNQPLGTALTDVNGNYYFLQRADRGADPRTDDALGYVPGGLLPDAAYEVRLDNPADYAPLGVLGGRHLTERDDVTASPSGSDLNDSDAGYVLNPAGSPPATPAAPQGWPVITVQTGGAGANNHTYDFGFVATVSLGNQVWYDTNNNKLVDGSEQGIPGVTLELFFDANENGQLDAVEQTPIASQQTITNGHYLFTEDGTGNLLRPGGYFVGITPNNFALGGMLLGYYSSGTAINNSGVRSETAPAVPNNDADNDDNGLKQPAGGFYVGGVLSGLLNVVENEPLLEIPGNNLGLAQPGTTSGLVDPNPDNASNLTLDFGFYTQSLGNQVWLDINDNGLRDAGEAGLNNTPVRLYAGDGVTEIPVGPDGRLGTADDAPGGMRTANLGAGDGQYRFLGLPQGDYVVKLTAPAGYQSSRGKPVSGVTPYEPAPDPDGEGSVLPNTDDDDNGSNESAASLIIASQAITLLPGDEPGVDNALGSTDNATVDFGLILPFDPPQYGVGNRVFVDLNNNARQDAGEVGIPGANVRLYRANPGTNTVAGAAILSTTTNVLGYYNFFTLDAGDYIVEVINPAGYAPTSSPAVESDPDADGDQNANGIVVTTQGTPGNPADPSAPTGVSRSNAVTLGPLAGQTITDTEPINEPDAPADIGQPNGDAHTNLTVDFGYYKPMLLGNRVWLDRDNSGTLETTEVGVPNVAVRYYADANNDGQPDGAALGQTTTDASGRYTFIVSPGTYVVEMTAPLGYVSSTGQQGSPTGPNEGAALPDLDVLNLDSQDYGTTLTPAQGGQGAIIRSKPVTLVSQGETIADEDSNPSSNLGMDFGLLQPLSLGNLVWNDLNNNGQFDAAEPTFANVLMQLYYDADQSGALETDELTTPIATTSTDANGRYLFTGLGAGDYAVAVTPQNFNVGQPLTGYDTSSGAASGLTGPYEPAPDADADPTDNDDNGEHQAGQVISKLVTLAQGTEPTAEQPDNDPSTPDANENLTVDFGFYQIYSLGNRVWFDTNNNGLLDATELGVDEVLVRLLTSDGQSVLAQSYTNAAGYYRFDNLHAGSYLVEIAVTNFSSERPDDPSPVLLGYLSSGPDEVDPNSNADSNDNGIGTTPSANGLRSNVITLGPGLLEPINEADLVAGNNPQGGADALGNMTVDFGFFRPLSLGNRLWLDDGVAGAPTTTNNGKWEVGERGLAGVLLNLLDATGNPVVDSQGQPRRTSTNANGYYLFADLQPGEYVVEVAASNFVEATNQRGALVGLTNSTGNSTNGLAPDPDDNVDQDDNGNDAPVGGDPVNGSIRTAPISLSHGAEPMTTSDLGPNDMASDGNSNRTLDIGFVTLMRLGNLVWHDANNDGLHDAHETAGEGGIPGVTLQLYTPEQTPGVDAPLASTTTDDQGNYTFANLLPGNYLVYIAQPPAAYPLSSSNTDSADNNEDDDDNGSQAALGGMLSGGPVTSPVITLMPQAEPVSSRDGDDSNGDATVDFGFFAPVSVGDTVWVDRNRNGGQDSVGTSEPGVPNVQVTLLDATSGQPVTTDANGQPIAQQTTDANGKYHFVNLSPGNYQVQFNLATLPAGSIVTLQDVVTTTDDKDSDVAPSGATAGRTAATGFLPSGTEDPTLDMGIYRPTRAVGNYVWADTNHNGVQDATERGIPGVTATLYNTATGQPATVDASGQPITPQQTDDKGGYFFDNLPAGDYYVVFNWAALPAGYLLTIPNMNLVLGLNNDATDSDGTLLAGQSTQARTDPTGPLADGELDDTLDLGLYQPVAVGDYVWDDADRNGNQDVGEPGVAGVKVTLYNALTDQPVTVDRNGQPIAPQTTDASGRYRFDALPPGSYYVSFDLTTLPTGYQVTKPNSGGTDASDSDADPVTGRTPATSPLLNSQADMTLDLGIFKPVAVGDTAWYDNNANGVQDAGEPGVSGVKVTLIDNVTGQPVTTDAAGQPVVDQTTDVNGYYRFANLLPGDYAVKFDLTTLPAGYKPTVANVGGKVGANDANDSDANPTSGQTGATGLLRGGEQDITLDMGIVGPVSVGDRVWTDSDQNGIQDAGEANVPNVQVTLFTVNQDGRASPAVNINGQPVPPMTTDATGNYRFANLPPGRYFVHFALATLPASYQPTAPNQGVDDALDSDVDPSTGRSGVTNFLGSGTSDLTLDLGLVQPAAVSVGDRVWVDANINGVQDGGEPGLPGVQVLLYNTTSGQPVTDAKGNPRFAVTDAAGFYRFSNLPPGDYYVIFDLLTVPTDYKVTTPDVGADEAADSDADPITGKTRPTGALSNGQSDLKLDLGVYVPAAIGDYVWLDRDADGVQEVGEPGLPGVTVTLFNGNGTSTGKSVTTDATGRYEFYDLPPGDYFVEFTPPTAGYSFSPANRGQDTTVDSDVNLATNRTPVTTLVSGEKDYTWDAGLYTGAAVGDYTWYDRNNDGKQGPDEPPLPGVVVKLFDDTGKLLGSTTTDGNGYYGFSGLQPGNYQVTFQPPPTYVPTSNPAGLALFDLTAGQKRDDVDAGFILWASIGSYVWNDGNQETSDGYRQPGELGVPGVTVILLGATGNEVARTKTDTNGFYSFTNLPPGNYSLQFVIDGIAKSFVEQTPDGPGNSDVVPATGKTVATTLLLGENDPSWGAGVLLLSTALEEQDEPDPSMLRSFIYLPVVVR